MVCVFVCSEKHPIRIFVAFCFEIETIRFFNNRDTTQRFTKLWYSIIRSMMADSIVEPSGSATISPLMQNQQQAVNLNMIPIHMDIDTASSQSHPRPPPINQSALNPNNSNDLHPSPADEDESKPKRRKSDDPLEQTSKSITNEKLESRLNGILCCAVCLDLPKLAMYQVRRTRRSLHLSSPPPPKHLNVLYV